VAEFYISHLKGLPLTLPAEVDNYVAAPNLFVIGYEARDELQAFLRERGIITGIHYPTPLHKFPAYRDRPWAQVSLPHTERLCQETLSLPLWFGISEEDQERVVNAIHDFFGEVSAR
jgi:dTDP-4-amino-4,6-dideoxygalactose transaminase